MQHFTAVFIVSSCILLVHGNTCMDEGAGSDVSTCEVKGSSLIQKHTVVGKQKEAEKDIQKHKQKEIEKETQPGSPGEAPPSPPPPPPGPPVTMAPGGFFAVTTGQCSMVGLDCVQSPNYPNNYGNSQACQIDIASEDHWKGKAINVKSFQTEAGWDKLTVNGVEYDGAGGPDGITPTDRIEWSADTSVQHGGWKICAGKPPVVPTLAPGALFGVTSGDCKMVGKNCVQSPNFPNNYGSSQACIIATNAAAWKKKTINVKYFSTEEGWDFLTVNNKRYEGNSGPDNVKPDGSSIRWNSDSSVEKRGWKLCGS